jgi:hypothetical protein
MGLIQRYNFHLQIRFRGYEGSWLRFKSNIRSAVGSFVIKCKAHITWSADVCIIISMTSLTFNCPICKNQMKQIHFGKGRPNIKLQFDLGDGTLV